MILHLLISLMVLRLPCMAIAAYRLVLFLATLCMHRNAIEAYPPIHYSRDGKATLAKACLSCVDMRQQAPSMRHDALLQTQRFRFLLLVSPLFRVPYPPCIV
jgi:hypothetical protein